MPEYYFAGNPGQTYTGPLTGAQYDNIIHGSNVQDVYGRMNQLGDWLAGYSQQATNFNAKEAMNLRSWQEEQNRKAMEFSAQQAASNREWQEFMSNTAHQREVADLKAAGLNPILSVNGGAGASTPSGSYAQGVSSAGAKSEFDTSASGSLVNLLGSMLSSMTQIADTATNAQANLAYADIMSAASEFVAGINKEASLGSAWLHADAAKYGYDVGYQEALDLIDWYREQQGKEHTHDIVMENLENRNKKGLIGTEYGFKAGLQDDEQSFQSGKQSVEHEHEKDMAANYPTTNSQYAAGLADRAAGLARALIDDFKRSSMSAKFRMSAATRAGHGLGGSATPGSGFGR